MPRFVIALIAAVSLAAGCSSDTQPAADARVDLAVGPDSGAQDAARDAPPDAVGDLPRDVFVPFELTLTVNRIPASMNGSQPHTDLQGQPVDFRLALPRSGFTVDALWSGTEARPETLEITSTVEIAGRAPGSDLHDLFARDEPGVASWRVPASGALPEEEVTFTAKLSEGEQQHTSALTVDIAEQTFMLDPFRLEDPWLLVFSQDLYTIGRVTDEQGNWTVQSAATPNGVADFVEDLRAIGLSTAEPHAQAAGVQNFGVQGPEAVMREWIAREIQIAVRKAFGIAADGTHDEDSVGIRFYREGEAGAPSLGDYAFQQLTGGETQKAFSAIGIGGGDVTQRYLGRSRTIDENNVLTEDNLGPGYGAFTTSALTFMGRIAAEDLAARVLLQALLGEFLPELGKGGVPVGQSPLDGELLATGFDPAAADAATADRHRKLTTVVTFLVRLAGALVAHEIGHSLGLVAAGPPPHGLFGGEVNGTFNMGRTAPGHVDTAGFNLMEAGPGSLDNISIDFSQYLQDGTFNALNLAYLRGRLLLLPR